MPPRQLLIEGRVWLMLAMRFSMPVRMSGETLLEDRIDSALWSDVTSAERALAVEAVEQLFEPAIDELPPVEPLGMVLVSS